ETLVALDAQPNQAKLWFLAITLGQRNADEAAIEAIGPSVIRAAELLQVARGVSDDPSAAVRAAVMQQSKRAVFAPDEDDLFRSQAGEHIVAGVRDLALVRHVQPGAAENAALFQREHRGVDVGGAMHRAVAEEFRDC